MAVRAIGVKSRSVWYGSLRVQRGVDHHHAGVGQHQRVAVGWRLHHFLRAHGAAGARLVVDHEGLAQHRLQRSDSSRACWSSGPPAGKPMTSRIGLSG
jgi:hypothetical protein